MASRSVLACATRTDDNLAPLNGIGSIIFEFLAQFVTSSKWEFDDASPDPHRHVLAIFRPIPSSLPNGDRRTSTA
jgi:hypothetical protein